MALLTLISGAIFKKIGFLLNFLAITKSSLIKVSFCKSLKLGVLGEDILITI